MMSKRVRSILIFVVICTAMFSVNLAAINGKGERIKASLSDRTVKVGGTVTVQTTVKDVKYKSSDTAIAYVKQDGTVIGKKPGIVTISVSKAGRETEKLSLEVVKKAKKPSIVTLYEEISVTNRKVKAGWYQMDVKNRSKGTVRKIVFTFTAKVVDSYKTDENGEQIPVIKKKTITMDASDLKSGEKMTLYCKPPASNQPEDMKLKKVEIYAGSSLVTYSAVKEKSVYTWGVADKKAPVISGMIGDASHYNKDTCITLYPDMSFDFSKYIFAEDERDGKCEIHVDTDSVNYKKPGLYVLNVTAEDEAGNVAKAKVRVNVRAVKEVDEMADTVLKKILKKGMSDIEKCRAIHKFTTAHLSYTYSSKYHNWEEEAVYAFRNGVGDCFAYYAVSKALLNRAGIPNIMVQRNTTNPTHYWNMVYIQKHGWYHFDTCKRQVKCYLCLLTDEQLTDFSNYYKSIVGFYPNTWDEDKYPKSGTKILTTGYR